MLLGTFSRFTVAFAFARFSLLNILLSSPTFPSSCNSFWTTRILFVRLRFGSSFFFFSFSSFWRKLFVLFSLPSKALFWRLMYLFLCNIFLRRSVYFTFSIIFLRCVFLCLLFLFIVFIKFLCYFYNFYNFLSAILYNIFIIFL